MVYYLLLNKNGIVVSPLFGVGFYVFFYFKNSVCVCHICTDVHGGQNLSDPLEL